MLATPGQLELQLQWPRLLVLFELPLCLLLQVMQKGAPTCQIHS